MSEKRRDSRGRILHNGEMHMSDGRYSFKYLEMKRQIVKMLTMVYRYGKDIL